MVYLITYLHKIKKRKNEQNCPSRQKLPYKGQFIKSWLSRFCTARWSGNVFSQVSPTNVKAGKSFLESSPIVLFTFFYMPFSLVELKAKYQRSLWEKGTPY